MTCWRICIPCVDKSQFYIVWIPLNSCVAPHWCESMDGIEPHLLQSCVFMICIRIKCDYSTSWIRGSMNSDAAANWLIKKEGGEQKKEKGGRYQKNRKNCWKIVDFKQKILNNCLKTQK